VRNAADIQSNLQIGNQVRSSPPLRIPGILQLYHRPIGPFSSDAATVMEHVRSLPRYSRFPVWSVNTQLGMPKALPSLRFGTIVLHYSVFAAGNYHLASGFRRFLADSRDAYKVAVFQDEYHFCRDRFAFLNDYEIDCVLSCLSPDQFEPVYGRYTNVQRVLSVLPGYVSDELVEAGCRFSLPDAERPIDIGYRGRRLPAYFGRGGLEKYEIGVRFLERAKELDLTLDIAGEEADRIYGDDWYRFIGGCRAVLGTESGTSVFDLEDEVHDDYARRLREGRSVDIDDLEQGVLREWDGKIPYRTAGPRHFEAAALRTCQILYEGRYSGIMEPMVHYIPLRKDFSNFDEAIQRFRDPEVRRELTYNAHRDLIASGAYSYETFVGQIDRVLLDAGLDPDVLPEQVAGADAALRRGLAARTVRTHLWELTDAIRSVEFPGKPALRSVVQPALRGLDRLRYE
jgi:hypothetical protein